MKPIYIEIEYDAEILIGSVERQYSALWNLQGLKALIKWDYESRFKDETKMHYQLQIHYKHNLTKTLCWKSAEKRDEAYNRIKELLGVDV